MVGRGFLGLSHEGRVMGGVEWALESELDVNYKHTINTVSTDSHRPADDKDSRPLSLALLR